MPISRTDKLAAKQARLAAAKQAAEEQKARKLHVIAARRAKQAKMSKADYIAAIVERRFAPITASDLAAEPDPE